MTSPCDKLGLFVDGELSEPEAEAFRDHLSECGRCQEHLPQLLLLERLGERYLERQEAEVTGAGQFIASRPRPGPPPRWRQLGWAVAACVLGVALFLGVLRTESPRPSQPTAEWTPPARTSATPRVSDPRVDHYRPIAAQLMGGEVAQVGLPLQELARLEEHKDTTGQAAIYLAWGRPNEALLLLEKLNDSTPDIQSNHAAALLALRRYVEALHLLDSVLTATPTHPQARWNRALTLEALQLPQLAARDFQAVAQAKEEGWAREADENARRLREQSAQEDALWKDTLEAGKELVATGRVAESSPLWNSPLLRLYFYEAVRTRTSPAQVRGLLPLAQHLDGQSGGPVLQRYVERTLRDFSRRESLMREYAALHPDFKSNPRTPAFLARLLKSEEPDLLVGALLNAAAVRSHLEAFDQGAQALADPWFELLVLQTRADMLIEAGDLWRAQEELEQARRLCERTPIAYRCGELELQFAHLRAQFVEPDAVERHATRGLFLAREGKLRSRQFQSLELLAKAARLRDDLVMARAYLKECLEHADRDPNQQRYIHQELAHLALHALDFDQARAELDAAISTGLSLTLYGAAALSDIARQRPNSLDEQTMNAAVEASAPLAPGRHALALHYLGRFQLEKNRMKGQAQLHEAIREADAVGPDDEEARHARTYSYTALILDQARAGDYDAALRLFGEELRGEVPERCVLAATVDSERSLVVVLGEDGATHGYYEGARTRRVEEEPAGLVPTEALAWLKSCAQVQVLARPPLQGLSRLLPASFAWSYRTQLANRPSPSGTPRHLVVERVAYAPERKLPLLYWQAVFGDDEEQQLLRGDEATPARVLRAMEDATEIDLVTHGILSPVSEASSLILARGRAEDSADELTVRSLRRARLRHAPLVVLAACHGGHAAPVLHEPVSLPNALITAGARAVLAATIPILDQRASEFFNAVRARMRRGEPPAEALRDERLAWHLRNPTDAWVDNVLLFE